MDGIIKLVPKKEEAKNNAQLAEESLDNYYESMEGMRDYIDLVLSISYDHDGQMIITSNGVDMKTAIWMVEEFKLNCLMGAFSD
jgi:hypothetical protein